MREAVTIERGTKLAAFVNRFSRKRKVYLKIHPLPFDKTPNIGGWQDGSRDNDILVLGVRDQATPVQQPAAFGAASVPKVYVDDYLAYVTVGTFCGKESTPSIECTQAFFDNYLKG